jgi:hypothetical protein
MHKCKDCEFDPIKVINEMELLHNGVSRRGFIKGSALTFSSFLFGSSLYTLFTETARAATPNAIKARACILLWMDGGPSQLDTWDPKPGRETGGSFKAISTNVPGIQISEHLASIAKQMDKIAIIRSMSTGEGNHERARYYLHTGFKPQATVKHPSIGAIVSAKMGDPNFDLPNFVALRNPSFGAGYFGMENSPFYIADPTKPIDNIKPPGDVDEKRFRERLSLQEKLASNFAVTHGGKEVQAHETIYSKTVKFMHSPDLKAFNLDAEPDALRDAYGRTAFGQGCLLARRLVESGVKFVEVTLPGWDTHQDNFNRVEKLQAELDPGFSTLLTDLKQRGMLDETLIIWMGEFGRTPKINQNAGRDHYPKAWSIVLAGGGIQGGRAIGGTDQDGMELIDKPISVPNLFASFTQCLGIDGGETNYTPQGRPIKLVDDGVPIKELFT